MAKRTKRTAPVQPTTEPKRSDEAHGVDPTKPSKPEELTKPEEPTKPAKATASAKPTKPTKRAERAVRAAKTNLSKGARRAERTAERSAEWLNELTAEPPLPSSHAGTTQPGRRRLRPGAWGWAVVLIASITLLSVESSVGAALSAVPVGAALLLAFAHSGSLLLVLVRPGAAGIVGVVAVALFALLSIGAADAPWPWPIPVMLTQILLIGLLGLRARWQIGALTWLAGLAISSSLVIVMPHEHNSNSTTANIVVATILSAFTLVVGIVVRQWQGIRSQLLQERQMTAEEHSRRVIAEEKTRIARELHDIIAHSMSIINVQATTAQYRHANVDAALVTEFDDIAASSRQALTEMRTLLGVLRDDGAERQLAPQPGLDDIETLVSNAERAGLRVTLEWTSPRGSLRLSDVTGLVAYRIAQEALSNVIRHAPDTDVTVRLDRVGRTLRVRVMNDAPGGSIPGEAVALFADVSRLTSRGHGLRGMRERASSVGGTVTFGPNHDGGFEVIAVVPLLSDTPAAASAPAADPTAPMPDPQDASPATPSNPEPGATT
ncbi:sensor histidine kinase [Plantibacter sp. YIM 135347]|uniref:sensor histidine kinase n=1 Tax=Plantibacter sp. YIM 135347 TaxID=3423919 RepID=UPI003D3313B3